MTALLYVIVKIAIMVSLGICLRKFRVIDERIQKGLSELLLKAILPFSIISSANYDYSIELVKAMLATGAAAMCYYAVTLVLMRKLSKKLPFEDDEKRIFVTMTVFANTGFVGFPLMYALYGERGLLLAVIFNMVYNLFMYTYGIHLVSGKKGELRQLILNPVTIASVAAIALFISPFRLPEIIADPVADIGAMTIPLSMIIIGSSIATLPFLKVISDVKAYVTSLMRLVIIPGLALLAMFILYRLVPIMPTTAAVIVLMCALPCGSMNVIFSEKYNCAPKFAARSVVQSMLLMVITLPIMIFFCSIIFI